MRNKISQNEKLEDSISVGNSPGNYSKQGFYDRVLVLRNKLHITTYVDFGGRAMFNMFHRETDPNMNLLLDVYDKCKEGGINLNMNWLLFGTGEMEIKDTVNLAKEQEIVYLQDLLIAQKQISQLQSEINTMQKAK